MKPTIRHSEIALHGRNNCGYALFTCYGRGLGSFCSDQRNTRKARQQARAYFNEQASKRAA